MTGIKGGKRNGREWWRAGRGGGSGYWLFLYPITPSCLTGLISRTEVHFAGVIQSRYARVVSSFPAAGALHFLFFWRGIFLSSVPNMEWRPSIECESKFIRLSRNWFFFFFFSNGVLAVGFKQMRALNNYKRILRSYDQCAKFGLQVPPKIVFSRINRFYSDHYQHLFKALVVTKIERAVIWTDGHLSKNLNWTKYRPILIGRAKNYFFSKYSLFFESYLVTVLYFCFWKKLKGKFHHSIGLGKIFLLAVFITDFIWHALFTSK